MQLYQHILLAADFSEHGKTVSAKAKQLAEQNQARLSLIHVVDYLPITDVTYGPIIPFDVDLTEELVAIAEQRLADLGQELDVDKERQWLEVGSPKLEIVRMAEENDVDLIVLGSHGRGGLAVLLGSTADGVLHHAKCDVLAVRLKDD
ncbi:universal stress protein [methane-oxidizing endosymbiont of Gigantopelta aegis]|uniref:universal stress protein n=1 Tax=methane-oxidizing endosymbiont of Gigantopelta aegis TaxID=2794938 RepID=UPI0018DEC0A1|nr:universal stress protein [methane-oxidizing endosymbiont of Gigantopelta aegis]